MSIDSRELRNTLGLYPTGVCVITANPQGYEPFGMTANSFASVSLDPPLVLWSIQNDSECFKAFEKATKYAVNFLTQEQSELSGFYAQKGDHVLRAEDYRLGRHGTPVLRGSVATFECDIWQRYDGGDHVILVGKVEEMVKGKAGADPLLFHAGKYRELR